MQGSADRASRKKLGAKVQSALDEIGFGFCQLEILFLAGGVFLVEGLLLVVSGIVVRTLEVRWNQTLWHTTALGTALFFGVTIGTVSGGFVSDSYGRRPAIVTCYLGVIVMMLLCAAGMHFVYHLFCNIVLGFFFGYGIPAANALICECCPSSKRSALVCSSAMLFAVGQIVAGMCVWVISPTMEYADLDWRVMSCLAAAVPAMIAPFCYLRLPESALWQSVVGDMSSCSQTLSTMSYRNGVRLDLAEVGRLIHRSPSPARTPRATTSSDEERHGLVSCSIEALQRVWETRAKVLFSDRFRSTTIIMTLVTFSSNFCYFGMIYILPDTFVEVMMWLQKEDPSYQTKQAMSPAFSLMLSAVFEIPGILLAVVLAQVCSRRFSLVLSFSVTSISALALVSGSQSHDTKNAVVVTSIAAFSAKLFIASAFILVYLYLLEVYPTNFRASGLAFAMTVGRLGAFFVPLISEGLMHLTGSSIFVFLAIGIDACIAALLCLCLEREMQPDDPLPVCPMSPKSTVTDPYSESK